MGQSLEDIIAAVPAAGASGTVGSETAKRIAEAIRAALSVVPPIVRPPDPKPNWKTSDEPKVSPKVTDYYKPKPKRK